MDPILVFPGKSNIFIEILHFCNRWNFSIMGGYLYVKPNTCCWLAEAKSSLTLTLALEWSLCLLEEARLCIPPAAWEVYQGVILNLKSMDGIYNQFLGGVGGGFRGARRGRGGRGSRDRDMIGNTIKITKGPYKGNIGIVKDVTQSTARIELHTSCQVS